MWANEAVRIEYYIRNKLQEIKKTYLRTPENPNNWATEEWRHLHLNIQHTAGNIYTVHAMVQVDLSIFVKDLSLTPGNLTRVPYCNSSPPSAAYMRQLTGSALVQLMACRLFGAKPCSKPILCYCLLDP